MTDSHSSPPPSKPPRRGWHYRGYLPHFDGGNEWLQFVTFRLADSLPTQVLEGWRRQLETLPESAQRAELIERVDNYLDAGHGACWLRQPEIATMVEHALQHFDGERYELHSWVVMPNHVHVLFRPLGQYDLQGILHTWKSFTAKQANQMLQRTGAFWQADYFDRYVRSEEHYLATKVYIDANPSRAGLCAAEDLWPFGSRRFENKERKAIP